MVGGDAYAQDATTVTSAGPSTSLTNKTSSPRKASNRSPTTALTDVQVSVDTSSTKMRGLEYTIEEGLATNANLCWTLDVCSRALLRVE